MTPTVVACCAHPDDEVVLAGGTLARLAAVGHRVVVVFATDGGAGTRDVASGRELGARRLAEARASATHLGVAKVCWLGYADSGLMASIASSPSSSQASTQPSAPTWARTSLHELAREPPHEGAPELPRFAEADLEEAAECLAEILCHESADVLIGHDRNGGYGHPDHVRAHQVVRRAGQRAQTPRLLFATAPREPLVCVAGIARFFQPWRFFRSWKPPVGNGSDPDSASEQLFSSRVDITHRVGVVAYAGVKRAALRAHTSQTARRGGADRMLRLMAQLPLPLFAAIFGREWFIDANRARRVVGPSVNRWIGRLTSRYRDDLHDLVSLDR